MVASTYYPREEENTERKGGDREREREREREGERGK